MARRARFGRQPRTQQSLNGTLVAIAREQQSRSDSNIMDAWKNGGRVDGHQVTDNEVLAYWEDREKTLDPKDPAYDTIKSQIMQLQYGIAQSKQDLLHVQGKITDQKYAQFFLSWAKKVPRAGEFWRVLQKDAATLIESAKARSAADADRAKQESFNKFVEGKNKDINLGNALTDAIQSLANESGLDVEASGDRLLEMLTDDYAKNPAKYRTLQDAIKSGAPNFDGTFTHDWSAAQIGNASQAYGAVATRAHKDGYTSAYSQAAKGQEGMTAWGSDLKVWSPAQVYQTAYEAFNRVWGDPNASDADKARAAKTFSDQATALSKTPGISPGTAQMFTADATRAMGGDAGDVPSFGPAMLGGGHQGIDPTMAAKVKQTTDEEALKAQNPGQFVYASRKPDGSFDPTGQGPVGIVAVGSVPPNVTFIARPGLFGQPQIVAVQPHDVTVKDPNDPGNPPVKVGETISYFTGGKPVTMYGYTDGSGKSGWTLRNPYADGVTSETDRDGNISLTPAPVSPAAQAAAIDKKYGTNITAQLGQGASRATDFAYQRAADGKVTSKLTITWDGTKFTAGQSNYTVDPVSHQVVEGSTQVVPIAINDPKSLPNMVLAPSVTAGGAAPDTYDSPVATSIAASATTMSAGQVSVLAQSPEFQHAFAYETMKTLGTQDPTDPRVVSAWNAATQKASAYADKQYDDIRLASGGSMTRPDLNYPGAPIKDPTKANVSVSFNGQQLNIPQVPAYLQQATQAQIAASPWAQSGFSASVLQPGQAPGAPMDGMHDSRPPAAPASITPITAPKPTGSPTPSPVPSPTPVATATPIASPTAMPGASAHPNSPFYQRPS